MNPDDVPGVELIDRIDPAGIPRTKAGEPVAVFEGDDRYSVGIRPSGLGKALDDEGGLTVWRMESVAQGALADPSLLHQLAALGAPDENNKTARYRIAHALANAGGGNRAATTGTSVHALIRRELQGQDVKWPADLAPRREAFWRVVEDAGLVFDGALTELIVAESELKLLGSIDYIPRLAGGPPVVVDLKSGKNATNRYGARSSCVQLTAYSMMRTVYDPATCTHRPIADVIGGDLDQTTAYVISVPPDGEPGLFAVDLERGREAVSLAVKVLELRRCEEGWLSPYVPGAHRGTVGARDMEPDLRSWLVERIEWLRGNHPAALADLAERWPAGVPTLRQSGTHDAGQLERIAEAVAAVEDAHQLSFADGPDPTVKGAA